MPRKPKFPSSVEIKRVIAAATRAGIEIGSIEIHSDKITIRTKDPDDLQGLTGYDLWKISQGENTSRVKHSAEKTDALPKKSRG